MKQNRIFCMTVVGCLAAGIAILACHPEPAEAAKKFTERNISVQKGKSYKLDDFLKLAATGKSAAGELRSKIKKGTEYTVSGKGLQITKRTFKGKKVGKYTLRIKTKKKIYVFPLCVVDKTYKLRADEVARIEISSYLTPPPVSKELNAPGQINEFVGKVNQTKFTFTLPKTLFKNPGFVGYRVVLYASDGTQMATWWLTESGFEEPHTNEKNNAGRNYTSPQAKAFYQYIEALYQNA